MIMPADMVCVPIDKNVSLRYQQIWLWYRHIYCQCKQIWLHSGSVPAMVAKTAEKRLSMTRNLPNHRSQITKGTMRNIHWNTEKQKLKIKRNDWLLVRKQPNIALYCEVENELKFYNLEGRYD